MQHTRSILSFVDYMALHVLALWITKVVYAP